MELRVVGKLFEGGFQVSQSIIPPLHSSVDLPSSFNHMSEDRAFGRGLLDRLLHNRQSRLKLRWLLPASASKPRY